MNLKVDFSWCILYLSVVINDSSEVLNDISPSFVRYHVRDMIDMILKCKMQYSDVV